MALGLKVDVKHRVRREKQPVFLEGQEEKRNERMSI